MSTWQILGVAMKAVGGLGLFLFGMHVMTAGLRAAAGTALRTVLARATGNPARGLLLGTLLGFLAHSGAATTLLASFTNAGLMSLVASIPPMLGANIGTSLSMQLVSFDISRYAWACIGVGVLARMAIPHPRWREGGAALLGFGLLFLGMATIREAVEPHREALAPFLAHIRGERWSGRLYGIGLSAALTALVTSSGAMIGLCFALILAGVFTSFEQAFPLVMGAHIGTCIVALTASAPMNIEARRSAVSHLLFNVFSVALALAVYPWLRRLVLASSPDLVRQTANLHTIVMCLGGVVVLPLARPFVSLLRVIVPSRRPPPEPSYLEERLLETPEQALQAVIRELRRMAKLCVEGMMLNGQIILHPKASVVRRLAANEEVIDEVKDAVGDYLGRLTRHHLSRRQTLFLQHLDRCMKDLERIGDHLTAIAETSVERFRTREGILPEPVFRTWFDLFCEAKRVVVLMERSLDPENPNFQTTALEILKARDCYMIRSMDAKAEFAGDVETRTITPIGGYFLGRYVADLDRLVRHAKSIAFAERQPDFWIKRKKLDRKASPAAPYVPPPLVDEKSYLEQLQRDEMFDADEASETQTGQMGSAPPASP